MSDCPNIDFSHIIPNPKLRKGIVAIVDALGVSNYSVDECREFFMNRAKFMMYNKIGSFKFDWVSDEHRKSLLRIDPFTFGDTIIFPWEFPDTDDEGLFNYLPVALEFLMPLIGNGLKTGLLLRGAISVGHFYADEGTNTIIGPAIADAAQWYDIAQWVGIIATPLCGKALSRQALQTGGKRKYGDLFCEYQVSLKAKNGILYQQKMWVVSWPTYYEALDGNPREKFYSDIEKYPIPKGTENKYYNTRDFFNSCIG